MGEEIIWQRFYLCSINKERYGGKIESIFAKIQQKQRCLSYVREGIM